MNTYFDIISKNKIFYLLNAILFLGLLFPLLAYSKSEGFMIMNQMHNPLIDGLFEIITFLGDGIFIILTAVVVFVFFKQHRFLTLLILISYLSSGLLSQIFKNLISEPRPRTYFSLHHINYYIDAFANARIGNKSFPSGHTATFFAMAVVLANYFRNRSFSVFLVFMSTLVGFSRVYLAHHFLIDVFAGGIFGVLTGTFSIGLVAQLVKIDFFKQWFTINNN
jgi:membrane-associated phospholipid phosphatase